MTDTKCPTKCPHHPCPWCCPQSTCPEGHRFKELGNGLIETLDKHDVTDQMIKLATDSYLGHADWIYDAELDMHIPCCSQRKGSWRCGNGPLTGDAIRAGDCGEHEGDA